MEKPITPLPPIFSMEIEEKVCLDRIVYDPHNNYFINDKFHKSDELDLSKYIDYNNVKLKIKTYQDGFILEFYKVKQLSFDEAQEKFDREFKEYKKAHAEYMKDLEQYLDNQKDK